VLAVTEASALTSVVFRRSTLIGSSRKPASNTTLRPENRAMAVKTARLLAELKVSESGSVASAGRSSPGGGRSRVLSTSACSSVLPPRDTEILVRIRCRVSDHSG
jgi:hypothetical protein